MQLDFINKQIVIDEVPQVPEVGKYYLLTRPIFETPNYNGSPPWFRFYTTKLIAQIMAAKESPVPLRCFRALKKESAIVLSNNKKVYINLVETGSPCGNVMFLFYYLDKYLLYTGEFGSGTKMLLDENVVNCIKENCLEDLYIDSTLALTENTNSIEIVCEKINSIIKKHPDKKFQMHLNGLGHEDIIWKLIKDYGIKIQLNPARKLLLDLQGYQQPITQNEGDAVITVKSIANSYSIETADRLFVEKNTIVLKFVPTSTSNATVGDEPYHGIYCIGYGPHPLSSDLYAIISALAPKHIYPIGPILSDVVCYNGFPSFLADLCTDMERFRQMIELEENAEKSIELNRSVGEGAALLESAQNISAEDVADNLSGPRSFLSDTPYSDLFSLSGTSLDLVVARARRRAGESIDDESNEIQSAAASAPIAENIRSRNKTDSNINSSVLARVDDGNAGGSSLPRIPKTTESSHKLPKRRKTVNKLIHKAQEAVVYASTTDSDTPPDLPDAISVSSSIEQETESTNSSIALPDELN